MRRWLNVMALLAVLVLTPGHATGQNPTLKTAMRNKLVSTQSLLEALVAGDFASMAQPAESLGRISEMEIILWQSAPQPEYRNQALLFILAIDGLRDAVAKANIDAALREYTSLVASCTRCHAHVRSSRTISVERPPAR